MALRDLLPQDSGPDPQFPSAPNMGGAMPQLPQTLRPLVTSPRQQQEDQLQGKISGFENPTKPQGFWQKLGHVASQIGNVALDIAAPGAATLIPGTQLNREAQHGANVRELAGLQNEDRQDTTAFNENAERQAQTGEATARTGEINARTNALENPPDKQDNLQHFAGDDGFYSFNPATGETKQLTFNGKPVAPPSKPDSAPKTIQIEQGGKPHQMAWDAKTGKYDLDQGESGEKPPVTNILSMQKEDRAVKTEALKFYQPSLDSAERFNVMADNAEKALGDHDQQAMLSLLANHLGMTMGLQKGARMTKDIIREAEVSQPWLQGVKAKFDSDGYLSGVNLSPKQIHQMVGLGQSRMSEDTGKARSQAKYAGIPDDGPERTPSRATINYYTHLANGDSNKAKELAGQDGWSVK
jgi:hypothetical protein